jgi:hypothetical protein
MGYLRDIFNKPLMPIDLQSAPKTVHFRILFYENIFCLLLGKLSVKSEKTANDSGLFPSNFSRRRFARLLLQPAPICRLIREFC